MRMKWDWKLALGATFEAAAGITHEITQLLAWTASAISADHDWRLGRQEWTNAVLEQIESLPEGTDG